MAKFNVGDRVKVRDCITRCEGHVSSMDGYTGKYDNIQEAIFKSNFSKSQFYKLKHSSYNFSEEMFVGYPILSIYTRFLVGDVEYIVRQDSKGKFWAEEYEAEDEQTLVYNVVDYGKRMGFVKNILGYANHNYTECNSLNDLSLLVHEVRMEYQRKNPPKPAKKDSSIDERMERIVKKGMPEKEHLLAAKEHYEIEQGEGSPLLIIGQEIWWGDIKTKVDKCNILHSCDGKSNSFMFKDLLLNKFGFTELTLGYVGKGEFPECKSIEDLSILVYALQREWVNKFGMWPDKNTVDPRVVVRKAKRSDVDNPFSIRIPQRDMEEFAKKWMESMPVRRVSIHGTGRPSFDSLNSGGDYMDAMAYATSIRMAQPRGDSNVKLKFGLVKETPNHYAPNQAVYCNRKPIVLKEHLELQEKPLKTVYIRFK